jgi:hypothetical protein
MSRYTVVVAGVALFIGLTLACTSNPAAPLAPSTSSSTSTATKAADGSTLKVTAPVPQSPVNDQKLTTAPVLAVNAATATFGTTPALQYRFEVYNPANTLVASGVVSATSFSVTTTLAGNVRHTWRVRAEFQGSVGPWSTLGSFITPVPFDPRQATFVDNPTDVATWAETAALTLVDTSNYIVVDHTKREGPGRWPESGFGDGGIQYTVGMCFNLNNHWYCSAAIQFWDGRDLFAGGPASNVAKDWYYDARWSPMTGHQPDQGEVIAMFVAQGNLRDTGNTSLKERSNFVLLPFGSVYTP